MKVKRRKKKNSGLKDYCLQTQAGPCSYGVLIFWLLHSLVVLINFVLIKKSLHEVALMNKTNRQIWRSQREQAF